MSLIGTGGGFFGSGGKTDSGNTKTTTSTFAPSLNFDDSYGIDSNVSPLSLSLGDRSGKNRIEINTSDYGAISSSFGFADKSLVLVDAVVKESVNVVDKTINAFVDLVSGNSADNAAIVDSSLYAVSMANDNNALLASESLNNSAFLADTVINSASGLAGQFGSDLAYLADSAMNNGALLVDKTINTVDTLTSQYQQSLNDFGAQLQDAQTQYSADVGYLTNQSMQANSELTSQFMMGIENSGAVLNDSLLFMADLQSKSLESSLEVAGNVALDDSVEGLREIFKYLSIAGAVVGVVYVFKRAA